MLWIRVAAILSLLVQPIPALAGGQGHGGPTPTCRKGCRPLSPAQVERLRQHPDELPPQIGGAPAR